MNPKELRKQSIARANAYGIVVPMNLPLLDSFQLRPMDDVVARLLTMYIVGAAAYGFEKAKAIEWLGNERLIRNLTQSEKDFLFSDCEPQDIFKLQIEAMWALAWAVGLVESLEFDQLCDDRFVNMFPNIKENESSEGFRERLHFRSPIEIAAEIDLAYCLHWAIREGDLSDSALLSVVPAYVIVERRRALEWISSSQQWADLSLDT